MHAIVPEVCVLLSTDSLLPTLNLLLLLLLLLLSYDATTCVNSCPPTLMLYRCLQAVSTVHTLQLAKYGLCSLLLLYFHHYNHYQVLLRSLRTVAAIACY
jgi:hypothetical protein